MKVLYENGKFWVCEAKNGKGYEVYRNELTHSVRCAIIGYTGAEGITKAIAECNRRAGAK